MHRRLLQRVEEVHFHNLGVAVMAAAVAVMSSSKWVGEVMVMVMVGVVMSRSKWAGEVMTMVGVVKSTSK